MSFYPIRYEYADESNSSRQSTNTDPPLYKQEEEQFHHFLDACNDPSSMQFTAPLMGQEVGEITTSSQEQQLAFGSPFGHQQGESSLGTLISSSSSATYWQPRHEDEEAAMVSQQQQYHHYQTDGQQHTLALSYQHPQQSLFQQQHHMNNADYSPQQLHHQNHQNDPFYDINEDQENVAPCSTKGGFKIIKTENMQRKGSRGQKPAMDYRSRQRNEPESPPHKNFMRSQHYSSDIILDDGENCQDCRPTSNIQEQWTPMGAAAVKYEEIGNERDDGDEQKASARGGGGHRVVIVGDGGSGSNKRGEEETTMDESAIADMEMENSREPQIAPNGYGKPAYSYSCLIGLSLKNSPSGELTVSEIYAFLCHHFPYFREAPSGWKNSVRHNLSLNKCFKKIEIETPGSHGRKSCLWTMNPVRKMKMDQELKKWRERDEPRILNAMERPEELDALQGGTIGMPPNMKPRRFVIQSSKSECGVGGHRQSPQNQRKLAGGPFSSSMPAIQQDHPYPIQQQQRTMLCMKNTGNMPILAQHRHPPVHQHAKPQQQQPLQSASAQLMRQSAESVHAQAARKLESLLNRQKSSSASDSVDSDGAGGGAVILPDGTGCVGKRGSSRGRKRRSTESNGGNSSSGHSSRRQSRHSNENSNNGGSGDGTTDAGQQTNRFDEPTDGVNSASPGHYRLNIPQVERDRQEAAAAFLFQQIGSKRQESSGDDENKGAAMREQQTDSGGRSGEPATIYRQKFHHPIHQMMGPSSHRPLHQLQDHHNLAIRIDQPFSMPAPTHSPRSISIPAPQPPPQCSPFPCGATAASLGLESCENALTHNPLLDPTLQLTQSPK